MNSSARGMMFLLRKLNTKVVVFMEKILSVIVPAYNMEHYLAKCLDSLVVGAEYISRLEVIIINDGSTDNTLRIAQEFAEKYAATFRVIDKSNGDYGSCVNRGLKEATGKYIKILDADDYFTTDNLVSFLVFLEETDADLVISSYNKVCVGAKTTEKFFSWSISSMPTDICDHSLQSVLFSKDFQMHAVTYKKDIFSELDYHQTEGISYTDQEWMFSPMTKVRIVDFFEYPIYNYCVGRIGQTMDTEVQKHQVGHNVKGLYKMLAEYKHMEKPSNIIAKYLLLRLDQRSSHIYKTYLLYNLPIEELLEVERQIRSISPDYYQHLDQLVVHKVYPYRFIRSFRASHKRTTLFDIYAWYMKLMR